MSEMRFNPIARCWVIISDDRGGRPQEFEVPKTTGGRPAAERRDDCPFCPGNEHLTTDELARLDDADGNWLIRTVSNKFPALHPQTDFRHVAQGTFVTMEAAGQHEVIIEHPRHDLAPADLSPQHLAELLRVFRERYAALSHLDHVQSITMFRNHGVLAGTSMEHPHSQVIGTPIVPPQIRARLGDAEQHFRDTGDCLFCCVIEDEMAAGTRLVETSVHFAGFVPYAALSPFHQWIFPKRHAASFDSLTDDEIIDLSGVLSRMLIRLRDGIDDPDFNLTIRSAPTAEAESSFFHWYIALVPRINHLAGFELGTGMHINPVSPEHAAERLRAVVIG